jgi:hypothetical protein
MSDHYPVSVLHEIRNVLYGVADVSVLLFEGALFASPKNRVAAKRDNHQIILGQSDPHSEKAQIERVSLINLASPAEAGQGFDTII